MNEVNERGILPPDKLNYDLLIKQNEIIESLVKLNTVLLDSLSQYMSVEEYEYKMAHILGGDDVVIE